VAHVLQIENLGKRYELPTTSAGEATSVQSYKRLSESLTNWVGNLFQRSAKLQKKEDFWALSNVSFSVQQGEVIGIIGRNGAGKSTLLKLLSRITEPTEGRIELNGRVASLLEVGTGFHPELTGRENIFLNGAILGMTRADIQAKFDQIVAFAEVEKFLDTPVKRYSSGMYVRLAFSVAAHLEPDILIIDEVLAVGDSAFQQKCLGRMSDVARSGRTILFVSHNLAAVRSLCSRVIYLQDGHLVCDDQTEVVLQRYLTSTASEAHSAWTRPVRLDSAAVVKVYFTHITAPQVQGDKLLLQLTLKAESDFAPCLLAFDISDQSGVVLLQAMPSQQPVLHGRAGEWQLQVQIKLPHFVPGRYLVSAWAGPHFTQTFDYAQNVVGFEITISPQLDRTFPYSKEHGYMAPPCELKAIHNALAA
jgi:lipopolysaccharide transport system ATP-binding protein